MQKTEIEAQTDNHEELLASLLFCIEAGPGEYRGEDVVSTQPTAEESMTLVELRSTLAALKAEAERMAEATKEEVAEGLADCENRRAELLDQEKEATEKEQPLDDILEALELLDKEEGKWMDQEAMLSTTWAGPNGATMAERGSVAAVTIIGDALAKCEGAEERILAAYRAAKERGDDEQTCRDYAADAYYCG